jgi:hypothetical protein
VICPRDQQQSVRQSNTTGKSAICRQEEFGEAARVLSLVVKLGLSDVYHRGPPASIRASFYLNTERASRSRIEREGGA